MLSSKIIASQIQHMHTLNSLHSLHSLNNLPHAISNKYLEENSTRSTVPIKPLRAKAASAHDLMNDVATVIAGSPQQTKMRSTVGSLPVQSYLHKLNPSKLFDSNCTQVLWCCCCVVVLLCCVVVLLVFVVCCWCLLWFVEVAHVDTSTLRCGGCSSPQCRNILNPVSAYNTTTQHNNTTTQQHNNTTTQQHNNNNTTTQQHSNTTTVYVP